MELLPAEVLDQPLDLHRLVLEAVGGRRLVGRVDLGLLWLQVGLRADRGNQSGICQLRWQDAAWEQNHARGDMRYEHAQDRRVTLPSGGKAWESRRLSTSLRRYPLE